MKTKLLYLYYPYTLSDKATVITCSHDDIGTYCIFNQTPFYPQGGGQPSDTGLLDENVTISAVKYIDDEVRHYTDRCCKALIGKEVTLKVDDKKRKLHSCYHTAGHLLAQVVESLYNLKAIKGCHFPGRAFVEFSTALVPDIDLAVINEKIKEMTRLDLCVESKIISDNEFHKLFPDLLLPDRDGLPHKVIRIGNASYELCGGTHIDHISAIKKLSAIKQKKKNGTCSIRYEVNI